MVLEHKSLREQPSYTPATAAAKWRVDLLTSPCGQWELPLSGPSFPLCRATGPERPRQRRTLAGFKSKLSDQLVGEMRLKRGQCDPAVAGFVKRIEGRASAQNTARSR